MESSMEQQRMNSTLNEAMQWAQHDEKIEMIDDGDNSNNNNHVHGIREESYLSEDHEDGDVYEQEQEEEEEEEGVDDPWLQEEVDKLIAEDANQPRDPYAYKPQLMDELEMRALRRELRTSEARLESDGHMREFVPRKPATRMAVVGHGRRMRMNTPRPVTCNALGSYDEQLRDNSFSAANDRTSPPKPQKVDYAETLRKEFMQCSALQDQYEDTKRQLLDHLDLICSTKPSERTTSGTINRDEAYKTLEELLAFAAKCAL